MSRKSNAIWQVRCATAHQESGRSALHRAVAKQEQRGRQCFFAATDFSRSVSLTLISEKTRDGARGYWQETFHKRPKNTAAAPGSGRKNLHPDRSREPVTKRSGPGMLVPECFYVLNGDAVLRISVGGVPDEDERLSRSTALLRVALKRLSGTL